MNKSKLLKWKIAASLVFLALLTFINSASAGLIMTGAFQTNATAFTPTWTVASSLIHGLSPTAQAGSFTANSTSPGVSALTDGSIGPISSSNTGEANAGNGGSGQYVEYTLPVQTYGYNLTNITVYSGWGNGGRVGQGYTVLYSTVADPGSFIWLTNVSYAAGFTGNSPGYPISIQVQLSDSAGGVIASNVAAIEFDFTDPTAPADENGGSGYSEITVQGAVATSVATPPVTIKTSNQNGSSPFTPTWTAETPDLIAGLLPSSSAGTFNRESTAGNSVLTDGAVGVSGNESGFASCGASGGTSLVYTLTNSVNGCDVTNIVVYSGWGDSGRDGQYYTLSYSYILAPSNFIPITTVYYLPLGNSGAQANRVAIFNPSGAPLAKNVSSLKFDFSSPRGASDFNNGWQGYSEIVVQGTNSLPAVVPPPIAVGQATFSPYPVVSAGTSVTASAPVTGPTPYFFQWQTDGGGGTLTNIPGATSSNLVINTTGLVNGYYEYALVASNLNNSYATGQVAVLQIQPPAVGISGVIGVKFAFTNDGYSTPDAPYPSDNTGVPTGQLVPPSNMPLTAVGNWNILQAAVNEAGSQAAAIDQTWTINNDSTGAALSGVTMTASGFNDGWHAGGAGCAAGRLLYDVWKINSGAPNPQLDGAGHLSSTLTFNNLPWSKYDVIVFVNDNNGNYWGNLQANNVVAQGGDTVDDTRYGFNGDDGDNNNPCSLNPPLHTFGAFGNPYCNYVRIANVETSGGTIQITAVSFGGGDMGIAGVELVPASDLNLVQDINPNYVEGLVGEPLALSISFSNTPPVNFSWYGVTGGVTNSIMSGVSSSTNNGVVTSVLTINSLQLGSSGSYYAKVVNAGNSADQTYSGAASIVVRNVQPAVNNVVLSESAQAGYSAYYPPDWMINTNADLIFGFTLDVTGLPGTALANNGNFGADGSNPNGAILTDGVLGSTPGEVVSCGPSGGWNTNMTYALLTNSAPNGFDITNIAVYGGWTDSGRRDQDYQVLYSTMANPTNFIPLFTALYLPADPSGGPISTRTTLAPASGTLAHNAAAVLINWDVAQLLNGYAFYSEIEVDGNPSTAPIATTAANITSAVYSGGNLILKGSGGVPSNANYTLLSTTNLTPPINWVQTAGGQLDGTGAFSNSIPINHGQSTKFYRWTSP